MNESFSIYVWKECDPYNGTGGPSEGLVILFAADCIEFFFGLPSNIWLFWIILKRRRKVGSILLTDFFPLSLVLIHLSFYLMVPSLLLNHFLWHSGWLFVITALITSSILILKPLLFCLMCVESYLAVVRPVHFLRFRALKYRWRALAVASCLYVILSLFVFKRGSILLVYFIFLPVLAVDTFCSVAVLRVLKQTPPGDNPKAHGKEKESWQGNVGVKTPAGGVAGRGREPRKNGEMHSIKKKAFITIFAIQVVLTINYLPYIFAVILRRQFPAGVVKCQFNPLSLAASISVSYLQPLIYLYNLGQRHKNS
ncbi:uncharacterized protein LOC133560778 isoform X2 [Nerophis ophidion]|nr:uncharacterized protein LOC133560778 isoform X2 [Nerophis ophidion]XP_061769679.1 uncharacterized protein LOC133560778 isoform X2 [Nerophis ophidion]XP_061769680.1 uncharacterized protein LOC133560778 isoform X2 [Nerophis ophidion]XP_061769681.1 uncharacterized protein LOC133560778 isoform X2 [Nerophis ophidion]XP_061769683.1 uncharacterized protein LOC133560778 isoform X2 [Nerophis ophidion]